MIKNLVDGYHVSDESAQNLSLYYICAREFGWTKREVDSHPTQHLLELLEFVKCVNERDKREMISHGR